MAESKDAIRLLELRRYRAMCEGDAATLDAKGWQMVAWQSTPLPA